MRKLLISWIICCLFGVLICYFLMQKLNVHRTYTEENYAEMIENQPKRLQWHQFYAELSFWFVGAEVLGFVFLVITTKKDKKKT